MFVDLSVYLEELKNDKLEIETSNDEQEIQRLLSEYEAKIRAEYAEAKAKRLSEKEIEIDVLERIIAREAKKSEEQIATQVVDNIAPVEPEVVPAYTEFTAEVASNSVESQSINNDFADL